MPRAQRFLSFSAHQGAWLDTGCRAPLSGGASKTDWLIDLKEFVHVVMEAEKSQDLQ